ncbi:hypothetical protein [Streptomyces sp. NPDC046332]|uniref:zinc finger domain-containing protein n=1 Tax=unclassified Streptomyces TaxID=2593676 RepID=UPI0033CD8FDC
MDPEQIPELIARIALADKRVRVEDPVEQTAQIDMWAGILAAVPYEYALQAAHAHYSRSTWPILPADIATRWAADVRDRLTRHTGTFEPLAHPELDPDDEAGYRAALAAERHAVATGQQPPNELRAITAGPAAAEVDRRLEVLGSYIPLHVRDVIAEMRPERADMERNAAAGIPNPLSVDCPYGPCRAPAGQRCRNRGQDRREPHPTRQEAATDARSAA